MSIEIDINKFQGIGVYTGDDGKEYLIMVNGDLPKKRVEEIVREMYLRKIDVQGHKYIPDEQRLESLREEWS